MRITRTCQVLTGIEVRGLFPACDVQVSFFSVIYENEPQYKQIQAALSAPGLHPVFIL
jgi:hypothetical protein